MANALESFFLPQTAQYSSQMRLLDNALREYAQMYAAYTQDVSRDAQQASEKAIENLARGGVLTGPAMARVYSDVNVWRANELSKAQLNMGMQRAAANQQRAELAERRSAATMSDVFNLGKFAVGAGLTAAGMGALGGAVTTTIPGQASEKFKSGFKPDRTITTRQYNPTLTSLGESFMGLQGAPFTATAMRGRYPELYQQPEYPQFTDEQFQEMLARAVARYGQ